MFRLLLILTLLLCGCGEKELSIGSNPLLAMTEEETDGVANEINLGSGSYRLKLSGSDHAMKIFYNNVQIFDIMLGAGVIRLHCTYPDNSYRSYIQPDRFIVQTSGLGEAFIGCESGEGIVRLDRIKVLGPQQPAIADATDPEDAVRAINQLLEAYRNHGSIAR